MELAAEKHLITVELFNEMIENGRFAPTARIELLGGKIYGMSPIGNLHARCVKFLSNYLIQLLAGKFIIGVQDPIILTDLSQPQPDIAVLRFQDDFYKQSHPHAKDVLLVIEVSDTTVNFDRSAKFPKYADAGIKEAWLINLEADRIEVHSNPEENTYETIKFYQRGEQIISETMPELKLKVDDVLG